MSTHRIEIGNKPLKELTPNDIIEIVKIIGCSPSLKYWHDPTLLDFSNTLFSDTIVVDYVSYRKSDNKKSCEYTFFFNWVELRWHYLKDFERHLKQYRPHNKLASLPLLRFLIKKGFNVPLY